MKLNKKLIALAIVCLAALVFGAGCSYSVSQHELNNSENYTVSVKYDANGGTFTTNTAVIVHTYNTDGLKANGEGLVEIPLVTPDDSEAGNENFAPTKNGYFFAGWYAERVDEKGANGDTNLSYSDMWDFEEDRIEVDPEKEYSSEEPVLTLYAAWIPLFEINYYDLETGELIEKDQFNPLSDNTFALPQWDEKTGAVNMNDFPEKKGYTFKAAFLDEDKKTAVDTEALTHPGTVNYENGTAVDPVCNVYVDWTEGEWFKISTAEQFAKSASVSGHYEILADLDFADVTWPTSFMYNNFAGEIIGNGHTFKNITVNQTNSDKVNAGLFGSVSENAVLSDITFENVTFNIKGGTRKAGATFGLFAGTISGDAALTNIKLTNSTMTIDSKCYFGTTEYSIGLVCGMGDPTAIQTENITCTASGNDPEKVHITVDGNTVTVSFS